MLILHVYGRPTTDIIRYNIVLFVATQVRKELAKEIFLVMAGSDWRSSRYSFVISALGTSIYMVIYIWPRPVSKDYETL